MNNVLINGRDFNNYLNYFGLKTDFSIEELERQKYIKSIEDKSNLKLEEMYKALLEVKLQDLQRKSELSKGEIHREEFVKGFKEKYDTTYPKYSNKEELNNKLSRVKSYVDAINKDNNITEVYDGYVSGVKDFMNLYSSELNERNHGQMSDVIIQKKDNITSSVSIMLNNSLDEVINKYNNDLRQHAINIQESNYLLRIINIAFKDVQKFYEGEKLDGIIGKYRNEIDTFLETKYNYYIKINDNLKLDSEEQKKKAKENFFKDFQSSVLSYFTSLFKKISVDVKADLDTAKEEGTIDNSLYTILSSQLNKATNLDDLATIYNRVHGEIKVVKFAK